VDRNLWFGGVLLVMVGVSQFGLLVINSKFWDGVGFLDAPHQRS
jgi:hypothetical protein